MKIEVCELMLYSWLKNIKGCQLVETNWSPSTFYEVNDNSISTYKNFISDIKELTTELEIDIIKKSNDEQFIKQTEIDVVGVKLNDGIAKEVYLVDTAFHESGVNYKDNTARIIKKIIRAIAVADLYFTNIPANIMFVSPYIGGNNKEDLFNKFNEINEWINLYYPKFKVKILFNESFTSEIYKPLLERVNNINDSNDLFMRFEKLETLCKSFIDKSPANNLIKDDSKINNKTYTVTLSQRANPGENEKIIFDFLRQLTKSDKANDYIEFLQDLDYSKQNFSLGKYPFLITESNLKKSDYEEKRFYKTLFLYDGKRYLVCSQWYKKGLELLDEWRSKML